MMKADDVNAPTFGGRWTRDKLEILRRYLDAYTTAMKNLGFRLIYVDAFAGAGSYTSPSNEYGEIRELHRGSAQLALEVNDKPFDRLVFIDRDPERVQSLRELAQRHPGRGIRIVEGDANLEIPTFCNGMSVSDRAVVFLDPYATQVSWATVEAIAASQKIDCWILFPIMAVTRMMPTDREPDEPISRQLDRIFGGHEHWQQSYRDSPQSSFWDDGPRRQRAPGNEQITDRYRERLRTVFNRVASTKRILKNSKNAQLFELFFAAGNPRGAPLAIKLADYILKKW